MATGLKTRIFYRNHVTDTTKEDFWEDVVSNGYKFLGRVKSVPNPFGEPNMVDVSTLEDLMEVQEEGRRSAPSVAVQIAFEKAYKDAIVALEGKKLDFVILYGTDGQGSEGVCGFWGTATFSPDEATAEHLTATVTISVQVKPTWIEDDYSFAVTEDATGYATGLSVTPA